MESRFLSPVAQGRQVGRGAGVSVTRISYHGWTDCFLVANGMVEAILVPAIGRVMQLRLAGDLTGAFWENRALDGQLHAPESCEWTNFGGDKCWPAPQTAWRRQQGRDWPPPAAFDAQPMDAVAGPRSVVMTSPVDPAFGLQVVRHVELDAERPVMRIRTEYRKLFGAAVRAGVWTITQMQPPERVYMLLATQSKFTEGYLRLMDGEPAGLRIEGGMLSLVRDPQQYVKIGADGGGLAWVGSTCVVRIDAERGQGEYPDGGCVTEVYTNPGPLDYVELETLGPLAVMIPGDRIERTTVYTVLPRSMPDPEAEAQNVFRFVCSPA